MKINNRYLIETSSGFQEFLGVRRSLNTGLIIKFIDSEIKCTKEHLFKHKDSFIKAEDLNIGDSLQNKIIVSIEESALEYYYDPVEVQGDNTYIADELEHHNCLVIDEAAFIKGTVWEEFEESIFPSQSGLAWKKNIMISTANGMNHFYHMVQGAKDGVNGIEFFEVNWRDVPRYKSDGSVYLAEDFMNEIINKRGIVHWNSNYENSFIGSSYTLISAEKLTEFRAKEPEMIQNQLKIYEFPEAGKKYVLAVDPAKDGKDAFTVQVVDITQFPFSQVATAAMQIDYLLMPEFLNEWGEMYNTALVIIENNEGAGQSIADQLKMDYEYPNLWHDKESRKSNRNKKYPGFRTTTRTRAQILKTLKLFIENGNLIINDKGTIDEFFTFIHVNNKYQADDGAKDDLIMGLAIVFAPFTDAKNFDDFNLLIKGMYSDETNIDFTDYLTIGNFDDFTDDSMHSAEANFELESFDGFIPNY